MPVRVLVAFLVAVALAAPAAAQGRGLTSPASGPLTLRAAASDTSPPQLVSFSITPETVDVGSSSQTVTVSMRVTDATGAQAPTFLLSHQTSTQTIGFGSVPRTSGTALDGVYSKTITVPQGSASGEWDAVVYPLADTLGNSGGFQKPATLTVTNPAPSDTSAPELVSFSMTPDSVDVAGGSQTVTISMRITDATGAEAPTFLLSHQDSTQTIGFGSVPRTSGTASDGVYSKTITIPQGTAPGAWDAVVYPLSDTLGNTGGFQKPATLTVGNPAPADTAAPQLVSFSMTPGVVDVASGSQTVTISMQITDATGAEAPTFLLSHQTTTQTIGFGSVPRTSGTASDGVYSKTITIPQGTAPGAWDAVVYPLSDTLGNTGSFQTPETLTISNRPPPTGGSASIGGTPRQGETLTCSTSGWSNEPSDFAFAWLRDGSGEPVGNEASYIVESGDVGHELSCQVVASNAGGSSAPVASAPVVVVAPPSGGTAAIGGTPRQGETLTCSTSGWSNEPSAFAFAWLRSGVEEPIGDAATHLVTTADEGHTLVCRVVASNLGGASSPATSAPVSVLAPPSGGAASITGTPSPGRTLTCSTSGWSSEPSSFVFAWIRSGVSEPVTDTATYVVTSADVGHSLTCRVVASSAAGSSAPVASPPVAVAAPPPAADAAGAAEPAGAAVDSGTSADSIPDAPRRSEPPRPPDPSPGRPTEPTAQEQAQQLADGAKPNAGGGLTLSGTTTGGKLTVSATTTVGGGRRAVAASTLRVFGLTRTFAPGAFRVTLKPSAKVSKLVRRSKRLKVRLSITFTPIGGGAATATRSVTLRYRKR
jgi:hypothetical protein